MARGLGTTPSAIAEREGRGTMNSRQASHHDLVSRLLNGAAVTMILLAIATATAEGTAYAHILGELLAPIAGALK
jgi:hypothetical protein